MDAQDKGQPGRYSIGELAEQAGVSRRTVRFYVQRGLIAAPLGKGRGEHYDKRHLARIRHVRRLQREGFALREIAGLAGGNAPIEPETDPGPGPAIVARIPLGPGATLEIDAGSGLATPETLTRLAAACARILKRAGARKDRP
jgi:DNA-binding transcriptional MerR regulator